MQLLKGLKQNNAEFTFSITDMFSLGAGQGYLKVLTTMEEQMKATIKAFVPSLKGWQFPPSHNNWNRWNSPQSFHSKNEGPGEFSELESRKRLVPSVALL